MEFKFTIPGRAVAKQSARFSFAKGFVRSYQKKEVVSYANFVKLCFLEKYPEFEPLTSAIGIEIKEYREVPKSKSNKFKEEALKGLIRPTVKPDTDNISKNIKDGLNKVAYIDDNRVVCDICNKFYDNTPRVEVTIWEIANAAN